MEKIKLTGAEWSVLDCLWEESPLTVMQMVARMRDRVGWAKSTTITVLRRMEAKARHQELSSEEIAQLREILREAEEGKDQ